MNPQYSESKVKENVIMDNLSADDLGVFVLGDYCNEIEQIFRVVYYCVPISCLVVTVFVICYFTIDK
jgi:hypothetical protein